MYTPEISCMKGIPIHIKNMQIKQLCNRKVREFAMALRARKFSEAFEKRTAGLQKINMASVQGSFYLLNAPAICTIFLHN